MIGSFRSSASARFTRYQPVSYKIFSRSGDRDEFAAMVSTCAAEGVDIYVDAVINHMTGGPDSQIRTGRAGTKYQYRQVHICDNLYIHWYPESLPEVLL